MKAITIGTLGDLIDSEYALIASCDKCGHSNRLDLHALVSELGRDFSHVRQRHELHRRLVCGKCRGKQFSVIVEPPHWHARQARGK